MTRFTYGILQNGLVVAKVDAPTKDQALREICHYAAIYLEDGPCEIQQLNPETTTSIPDPPEGA